MDSNCHTQQKINWILHYREYNNHPTDVGMKLKNYFCWNKQLCKIIGCSGWIKLLQYPHYKPSLPPLLIACKLPKHREGLGALVVCGEYVRGHHNSLQFASTPWYLDQHVVLMLPRKCSDLQYLDRHYKTGPQYILCLALPLGYLGSTPPHLHNYNYTESIESLEVVKAWEGG